MYPNTCITCNLHVFIHIIRFTCNREQFFFTCTRVHVLHVRYMYLHIFFDLHVFVDKNVFTCTRVHVLHVLISIFRFTCIREQKVFTCTRVHVLHVPYMYFRVFFGLHVFVNKKFLDVPEYMYYIFRFTYIREIFIAIHVTAELRGVSGPRPALGFYFDWTCPFCWSVASM